MISAGTVIDLNIDPVIPVKSPRITGIVVSRVVTGGGIPPVMAIGNRRITAGRLLLKERRRAVLRNRPLVWPAMHARHFTCGHDAGRIGA